MSWIMNPASLRQMWESPLLVLQARQQIPSLFGLTQFAHEGLNADNTVSLLAGVYNNWAGLKYAPWMTAHGAVPVDEPTHEWDPGTGEQQVTDAFASFPNTGAFLDAWADLLMSYYRPALAYADDPLLYGAAVWRRGWATDPLYIVALSNRLQWVRSAPAAAPQPARVVNPAAPNLVRPVPVIDPSYPEALRLRCVGWIDANGITWAPLRAVAEAYGGDAAPEPADGAPSEIHLFHSPTAIGEKAAAS